MARGERVLMRALSLDHIAKAWATKAANRSEGDPRPPVLLISAWIMSFSSCTCVAILFTSVGVRAPGAMQSLAAHLQYTLALMRGDSTARFDTQDDALFASLLSGGNIRFGTTCLIGDSDAEFYRSLTDEWLPEFINFLPAIGRGIGYGVITGAAIGWLLALKSIRSMWVAYRALYRFFWDHGPATLRFPIRRADSVRILSTIVAYSWIGMCLLTLLCAALGLFVEMMATQWSGIVEARKALTNSCASVMVYLFFIEPILAPMFLVHRRFGPALFAIEIWNLQASFVRSFVRPIYAVLIMLPSFFNPAQCILPDGWELWDPGHITFASFVMERVHEDRKHAVEVRAMLNLHGDRFAKAVLQKSPSIWRARKSSGITSPTEAARPHPQPPVPMNDHDH
eukprot:CAMPEP_0115889508 /NCGR_PEP_ID=MMETSP0287-20121206/32862_1 /TAXON_ID=412157 /ORGANISM="Chrysochromulina rotalis, Strain UIO044" /LENGTH=396 /DNA_ID=CAMNT_0003346231 /DNA_START=152 /DNA_END=1342 /DNA_ORIENTATION=+